MAAKDLLILVKLKDEASKELTKLGKDLEKDTKIFKTMGIASMAAGGLIVAGLGAATKAAAAEQVGINRLQQQLKNVNVEYKNVENSLESVISATVRKTGIADDQQRIALGDLVTVTGDYKKAMDLLPLALDLAASKQIDVSSAAEIIGKVSEGNISILSRYGIQMKEGATAAEALAILQQKVGGTAQAAADPMKILENTLDDLQETIGGALLGDMNKFLDKATQIVIGVTNWVKQNPELVRTLAAVGVVLLGAGGILFAVSQISKAIIALNIALAIMQGLSGPAGWVNLGVGLAATGAAILGIQELMKSANTPSYEYGGVVPGAIGQPQLAVVHGGERYMGTSGRGSGGGQVINMTVNVGGSVVSNQELVSFIRESILQIKTRNTSSGF